MSKTFTFRFNEVSTNQVWFKAENEEEAKALMQKVQDDEMNVSDLPGAYERNRGIEFDFSVSILEDETPACTHPSEAMVHQYSEDSLLGDSYWCGSCGDLLQVG